MAHHLLISKDEHQPNVEKIPKVQSIKDWGFSDPAPPIKNAHPTHRDPNPIEHSYNMFHFDCRDDGNAGWRHPGPLFTGNFEYNKISLKEYSGELSLPL
jgi:hypothetical protein